MSGKIIYISGGARSGKSSFAQKIAENLSSNPIYIATAQIFDQEMEQRVTRHRNDRDQRWLTYEEPLELANAIRKFDQRGATILVDCLTLWLTNLMMADRNIVQERLDLCNYAEQVNGCVIFVSNEVGMGIVPTNALSRCFVDEAGFLNQSIAAISHEAYFIASGIPIKTKGGI